MERRGFFVSLVALIAAPFVPKAKGFCVTAETTDSSMLFSYPLSVQQADYYNYALSCSVEQSALEPRAPFTAKTLRKARKALGQRAR